MGRRGIGTVELIVAITIFVLGGLGALMEYSDTEVSDVPVEDVVAGKSDFMFESGTKVFIVMDGGKMYQVGWSCMVSPGDYVRLRRVMDIYECEE